MRLFGKQPEPVQTETGYQDVVDYLRDMTHHDYTKILKVVNIYRDADKAVKRVLNIKDTPADQDDELFTDTEIGNFIDDEPVSKVKIEKSPKPKGKK